MRISVYLASLPEEKAAREALLKKAAAEHSKTTADFGRILRTPQGKPYFPEAPELHFSVSHSGAYWACAFSDAPVGLDIQMHQHNSYERLANRFFHPEEAAYLAAKAFSPEAFFRIWTAKESYLKRTGEGLPGGLSTFSVLSPLPDGAEFTYLAAPEGYTMCLCGKKGKPALIHI